MAHSILLVEKDDKLRAFWEKTLQGEGFGIRSVSDREKALDAARRIPPDIVFLGSDFSGKSGITLLKELKGSNEDLVVISPTNEEELREELEATETHPGLSRPPSLQVDQVKIAIRDALRLQESKRREDWLLDRERALYRFENVVAESPKMQQVLRAVSQVLPSDVTVLISGETGTGKEVIAKAIHYNGPRAKQMFLALNCTALPENLLESELFGYEAGAFTDARRLKKGLFEVADGGTLFLDEVGDLPPALQGKLLRVVEEKTLTRLGGTVGIPFDTRIIAATNRDLEALVREGKFREDLYFRLKVLAIDLPPLREHKEDLIPLARHFVEQLNRELKKQIKGLSFSAERRLADYDWPGNIRELRNVIERAVLFSQGDLIQPEDLFIERTQRTESSGRGEAFSLGNRSLKEIEKECVIQALSKSGWNQTQAARLLKISRFALLHRIKKFKIRRKAMGV